MEQVIEYVDLSREEKLEIINDVIILQGIEDEGNGIEDFETALYLLNEIEDKHAQEWQVIMLLEKLIKNAKGDK